MASSITTPRDVITANDYYPGGMLMPGRTYQATPTSKYRFSINGQEKESDLNENITTALYWEYDSRIGRRWNVDPKPNLSESPYMTFSGNPVFKTDILGDKAYGDYYKKDGKWLGNDGRDDHKVYVVSDQNLFDRGVKKPSQDNPAIPTPSNYVQTVNPLVNEIAGKNVKLLSINKEELLKLAGTAYGESAAGFGNINQDEIYGISNAIGNYKRFANSSSYSSAITGTKAFAATDGNKAYAAFAAQSDEGRNNKLGMLYAIGGAINEVTGGKDYTNGGVKWAGTDAGSKREKWAEGMKFTNPTHDIYNLGDNKKTTKVKWGDGRARGGYDYKWESTAATGGTIFMKLTAEAIKLGIKY